MNRILIMFFLYFPYAFSSSIKEDEERSNRLDIMISDYKDIYKQYIDEKNKFDMKDIRKKINNYNKEYRDLWVFIRSVYSGMTPVKDINEYKKIEEMRKIGKQIKEYRS